MRHVYAQWVILNALLFTVGFGLGGGHFPFDFDGLNCPYYEPGSTLRSCAQFGGFLGAISGVTIGLGQFAFLRKRLPLAGLNGSWKTLSARHNLLWVLSSALAFAIGHAIGDSGPIRNVFPVSALGLGLFSSMLVGAAQVLIGRTWIKRPGLWLATSSVGFGVGLGAFRMLSTILSDETVIELMIFTISEGLVVGLLWGAFTGWALSRGSQKVA